MLLLKLREQFRLYEDVVEVYFCVRFFEGEGTGNVKTICSLLLKCVWSITLCTYRSRLGLSLQGLSWGQTKLNGCPDCLGVCTGRRIKKKKSMDLYPPFLSCGRLKGAYNLLAFPPSQQTPCEAGGAERAPKNCDH
uniref:Uncharacterized protein n=1 Tax=Sphaerodactylus townsendi TaxID=933632 RepID=A0ACB8FFC7_9SAUR